VISDFQFAIVQFFVFVFITKAKNWKAKVNRQWQIEI
jgi:hypothetical protein